MIERKNEIAHAIWRFVWWEHIHTLLMTNTYDPSILTRKIISELKKSLSYILNHPTIQDDLIVWISHSSPLKSLKDIKELPYIIRAVCRNKLSELHILQIKKDLWLLLFDHIEIPPSKDKLYPPHFPSRWKEIWNPLPLLQKYLHIPHQRFWAPDEYVMLMNVERSSVNGQLVYVLAESVNGNPWKQKYYAPSHNFLSQESDNIIPAEIRLSNWDTFLWFQTEQYIYRTPSKTVLNKLLDMMTFAHKNESLSLNEFWAWVLSWYLALQVLEQNNVHQYIDLNESFYINVLSLLSQTTQEHTNMIRWFIDINWLPHEMQDLTMYCEKWVTENQHVWYWTKQEIEQFLFDGSDHELRNKNNHLPLLKSAEHLIKNFCKHHYLSKGIVQKIHKIE